MVPRKIGLAGLALIAVCHLVSVNAQVYSPWVLNENQPDTRDLERIAQTLYQNAGAETEREKAEAIWRYLLTDGRFVEPGVFYHIAGWAYEEPMGEVLDPIKLLNSYGFGLCYQIAPLLEALWEAGGFPDARSWFVTGHTVAEVYFDSKYNMLDSDMLGYTTIGEGNPRISSIASVRELEEDESIILGKMLAADKADASKVSDPWYPADVRAKAMGGYAGIFTSKDDNWLYPLKRFPAGHSMDFVLRPGERMIRFFEPESEGLFYLPFKRTGEGLSEFPRESHQRWGIRTEDGPRSQKDSRLWATGRIEYQPFLGSRDSYYPLSIVNLRLPSDRNGSLMREDASKPGSAIFEMSTPYLLINADFRVNTVLATPAHRLTLDTSVDNGRSWQRAGSLLGPFVGVWKISPQVFQMSDHGVATAVSGMYGYLVRLKLSGPDPGDALVRDLKLTSLIQLNPRTLPFLEQGENRLSFVPGPQWRRWNLPVDLSRVNEFAERVEGLQYLKESGNGFLSPQTGTSAGEVIFEVSAPDGSSLEKVSAGGRFLVLNELGPEKLTAETRTTGLKQDWKSASGSLEWALAPTGPWKGLWEYRPPSEWLDGEPIKRLLVWPEVDEEISELPLGTKKIYLRYALSGMSLDGVRMAAFTAGDSEGSAVKITHHWDSRGVRMSHSVEIVSPDQPYEYLIRTKPYSEIENHSIVFECHDLETSY